MIIPCNYDLFPNPVVHIVAVRIRHMEQHGMTVEYVGFSCYLLLKYRPTLVTLKYLQPKEYTVSIFCQVVLTV